MPTERDWVDYASLAVSAFTLLVTFGGLWFVISSLRQAAQQQRVEAGPYVRVDLGSADLHMPDFHAPPVYYTDQTQALHLEREGSDENLVTLSAWFRNYQTHPLGMAFGVVAQILVERIGFDPVISEVRIPYLERDKAVLIHVARVNHASTPRITLLSLSFLDFYDRRHEHQYGEKGTNALHGRLVCSVEDGRLISVPEGRSRGEGVSFDSQAVGDD
jgi:hypothetical protein